MAKRVFNFSAGPATLPEPVLAEARDNLMALPGVGASVMEISHRSSTFKAIIEEAEANMRSLLAIPDDYAVLFLQGGASQQFAQVPMNIMPEGGQADYVLCGSWAKKALVEGRKRGTCNIVWDGSADQFTRMPKADEWKPTPGAAYVHMTSNETIEGIQFDYDPDTGDVPLVCDASSDILCRPIDISKYGIIYAGAQKNIGPAGMAMVIIRKDLLERAPKDLAKYFTYKTHADANSLYNTPPSFTVYVVMLVTRWLKDTMGGLEVMEQVNREKAALLYEVIDQSGGFYRGHAAPDSRSIMNVTWRLQDEVLEADFAKAAEEAGLAALKGHRSVGGLRASIYNAMPTEGVEALVQFMEDFQEKNA